MNDKEGRVAGVATGPAEYKTGGPEGGLEGRTPEGAAGPSPAAGEAATAKTATPTATRTAGKYRYKMPFRMTRLGGTDYAIGVCSACKRVIRPVSVERSRTGNHGWDNYEHEHELSFIVLVQSNAGNRRYYYENIGAASEEVKAVLEMAAEAWTWYRSDVDEIRETVDAFLRRMSNNG